MRCPSCNQWLIGAENQEVEIDYCPTCGIWLDDRELELLAASVGASEIKIGFSLGKSTVKTKRFCPRCNVRLQTVETIGNKDKVILDQCPAGHGLWFDKGELEKTLLAFEKNLSENPPMVILLTFIRNLFRHSPFNPGKL